MAAAPNDINIFGWLFDSTDGLLTHYATDTSARVIDAIAPVAVTCFGIFVLLWAFAHLRNTIEEPVTDGALRLVKVAVILGIALNITNYGNYVVDFAVNTPLSLAAQASSNPQYANSSMVGKLLDHSLNEGFKVGQRAWDQGGITSPGPVIIAIVIWVAFGLILLFAATLIMLSKVALVVLLALGPIFILLLLFKATQRFFEVWFGQVVNFMVTIVLAVLVTALLITLIDGFLTELNKDPSASTGKVLLETIVVGGIGVLVLRQVPAIASAIAGGIALSTLGSFGATMRGSGLAAAKTGKGSGRVAAAGGRRAWNSGAGVASRNAIGQAFRRKNTIAK